jgi:hypothetical protein
MATIATLSLAGQTAIDNSNAKLAALLDRDDLSAGEMQKAMTDQNAITAFAQGFLTKQKDDNKFVSRLA